MKHDEQNNRISFKAQRTNYHELESTINDIKDKNPGPGDKPRMFLKKLPCLIYIILHGAKQQFPHIWRS